MIDTRIVRAIRKTKGWSVQQLVNVAGVSGFFVNSLETRLHAPNLTDFEAVLYALGFQLVIVPRGCNDLVCREDVLKAMELWKDIESFDIVKAMPNVVIK